MLTLPQRDGWRLHNRVEEHKGMDSWLAAQLQVNARQRPTGLATAARHLVYPRALTGSSMQLSMMALAGGVPSGAEPIL